MTIPVLPSYFGPSPLHEEYDLTALVYEADGSRRNLPFIQFRIKQTGRTYVTYRNGFDPPSAAESAAPGSTDN